MDHLATTKPLRPKPLSFTNGLLKRHSLYKECLRNHAAPLGGHALDGCGEFMPSDPTSLKCAACGCHRNFHRRDYDDDDDNDAEMEDYNFTPKRRISNSPPMSAPHMLLALSADPNPVRKRFRTKFSREQKEKMLEFSERLGWKMRKQDEGLVDEFCREISVGKDVFKVWMHNNKYRDTFMRNGVVALNSNNNDSYNGTGTGTNPHLMNGSTSSS